MNLFETTCPLCKGSLWIDPATMKIIDHKPAAGEVNADFEQFLKDRNKPKGWDDRMAKAKEEEAKRKAEIEQKFKQAKETKDTTPSDGMRTALDWD